MKYDIVKSAGVIIVGRKILLTRTRGKDFFIAPGGKLEAGESREQCLVRELKEELGIDCKKQDFELVGIYTSQAIGTDNKTLQMPTFMVKSWKGEILPQQEVEEVIWVDSSNFKNYVIGPIFANTVIPELIDKKLID